MTEQDEFHILFVCSANLCRSQFAEAALRQRAAANRVVRISSAGTRAVDGEPVPERFRGLFGRDADTLAARRVSASMLARADLVLTMSRSQRASVVQLLPRSVRYTYPFVQFVELAERVATEDAARKLEQPGDFRALVNAVQAQRGVQRGQHNTVDIPDPAHAGAHHLRKVTTQILDYVDRFAGVLQLRPTVAEQPVVRVHARLSQVADVS